MVKKKGRIPDFESEEEEAKWWDSHSAFDHLGELEEVDIDFELAPAILERHRKRHLKRQITIRLDQYQIDAARLLAKRKGMPYQTLLRAWIATAIEQELKRTA